MSKTTKLYEFYVCGRGRFPWDMLRYDSCWPATSTDADNLEVASTQLRVIRLRGIRKPTLGRWSSFLWACADEDRWTEHGYQHKEEENAD